MEIKFSFFVGRLSESMEKFWMSFYKNFNRKNILAKIKSLQKSFDTKKKLKLFFLSQLIFFANSHVHTLFSHPIITSNLSLIKSLSDSIFEPISYLPISL
jgi:hypothetical protein